MDLAEPSSWRRHIPTLLIGVFLVVLTVLVYWQLGHHEFVHLDDDQYVAGNYHVRAGLTSEGVTWAFSNMSTGHWHPLTWLSLMLDSQLFGLSPKVFHLSNLFFHAANVLLLFLVLLRMTGARWRSAFVAAVFALHPLHVESVAWAAERKDVLSTFFWILTMGAYARYVEKPAGKWYGFAILFFILGLLSKAMLVTLPCVLLLLDYWPLARTKKNPEISISYLIFEKIPFFALAAIMSVLSLFFEKSIGAMSLDEALPFSVRANNALVSYVAYIGKLFWPSNLAVFYPYSENQSLGMGIAAGLFLALITFLVVRRGRKMPWLAVGWFWYLGTLVPVIGLVQVGLQSMADRYMYVPMIGLLMMIAWSVPSSWESGVRGKSLVAITAVLVYALMVLTWSQNKYWQNSFALFEHTLDVTTDNAEAQTMYGGALMEQGKTDEAIGHFIEAIRIRPKDAKAEYILGVALASEGKHQEALEFYAAALRAQPEFFPAYDGLGVEAFAQGKIEEAVGYYNKAIAINPDDSKARYDLGVALTKRGNIDEAIVQYDEVLRINPDYVEAHNNLGAIFFTQGKFQDATAEFKEVLRIQPDRAEGWYNLGCVMRQQGKIDEAIKYFTEALHIQPDHAKAHLNLGISQLMLGNRDAAIAEYNALQKINPELAKNLYEKIHS
jgi:tetratricopeptide (TPR) repeat protein